jgi:hypothetical protein
MRALIGLAFLLLCSVALGDERELLQLPRLYVGTGSQGLTVTTYGNWCGATNGGFSNCCSGQSCSACTTTACSTSGCTTAQKAACRAQCTPIDPTDELCMDHDYCIAVTVDKNVGNFNSQPNCSYSGVPRGNPCQCDKKLLDGANSLPWTPPGLGGFKDNLLLWLGSLSPGKCYKEPSWPCVPFSTGLANPSPPPPPPRSPPPRSPPPRSPPPRATNCCCWGWCWTPWCCSRTCMC